MYFVEIDKVTVDEELQGVYSGDIDNMRMDYPAPPNGCTFKQAIQIFKDMYLKDKLSKHFPYRFTDIIDSKKDNIYFTRLCYYDENDNVLELAKFTPYYIVTWDNYFEELIDNQKITSLSKAFAIKEKIDLSLNKDYDECEEADIYVKYEFKNLIK